MGTIPVPDPPIGCSSHTPVSGPHIAARYPSEARLSARSTIGA